MCVVSFTSPLIPFSCYSAFRNVAFALHLCFVLVSVTHCIVVGRILARYLYIFPCSILLNQSDWVCVLVPTPSAIDWMWNECAWTTTRKPNKNKWASTHSAFFRAHHTEEKWWHIHHTYIETCRKMPSIRFLNEWFYTFYIILALLELWISYKDR